MPLLPPPTPLPADGPAPALAILVGVPLTFTDFAERVERSDWLSKFDLPGASAEERTAHFRSIWTSQYAPLVAEPFSALVSRGAAGSISVFTQATLADLQTATATHEVVILFAHWKGPEILHDDVARGLDLATLQGHAKTAGVTGASLRSHLESSPGRRGFSRVLRALRLERKQPDSVRDILGRVVDTADVEDTRPGSPDMVAESAEIGKARRRDQLDSLLAGLLRPGNRLELYDGLHAREQVAESVFDSFRGVLDLTTCTSTYLSDYIGGKRRHACRTIQFPTPQKFDWAARCVDLALEIFLTHDIDYLPARKRAVSLLTELVAAEFDRRNNQPEPA